MPNRILREGILTSDRLESLNWAEEVFYRRLMSVVDDYGRYYSRPALLRASCYPLLLTKVSDSDIEKWLTACVNAALIRVYPAVDGKSYLELIDFKQQVRATKSKFPDPRCICIASATQPGSMCEACAHLVVDVCGDVGVGGKAPPPPKPVERIASKRRMPEGFAISDSVRAWAGTKGYLQLDEHLEAFRRKAEAKGYTYVDWDKAFMEAIREDWAKLRGGSFGGAPAGEKPRFRKELGK